ncbi:MAG: peptidylprolyl isomerase [Candidatus Velthaea sp.]
MSVLAAVTVAIFTSAGEIDVRVDDVHAPQTAANFLRYVKRGYFDGGTFFRTVTTKPDNQPGKTVKIDVIQATHNARLHPKLDPPVHFEATSQTGILHRDGTVSMARDAALDTAQTDFFICIGAQPGLDDGGGRSADHRGFAAFAQVTRGMGVVRAIHAAHAKAQILAAPVRIERIVIQAGSARSVGR